MQYRSNTVKQILGVTVLITLILTLFMWPVPAAVSAQEEPVPPDQEISFAVEEELLFDGAVPVNRIDIVTTDGIVTLTGVVSNLRAKERATRLAETVKGVRAVVNQIEVEPIIVRSNIELTSEILDALTANPATDAFEIKAVVEEGRVTLTGVVQSWQEKELVETVVKGVQGVTAVDNQVEVLYEFDRTDEEIAADVRQAFRWDAYVDHALIEVDVSNDQVFLSGVVGSAAEKRYAATDAWVAGVQAVDDSGLIVERWARDEDLRQDKYRIEPDLEIAAAVRDALQLDPRINDANVDVVVRNGFVTLRGVVASLEAKKAAAQDARGTVGVVNIANRLKVRPDVVLTDEEIAVGVRNALARDPDVSRFDIEISVIDGVAYLSGTVDSYFEKGQADLAASQVSGVEEVRNNLEVSNIDSVVVYEPYVYDFYPYETEWFDYQPYYTFKQDALIEEDVNSELWWSPFVDSEEVNVSVENGVVTLTGVVDTWGEREAATENAYEGGATWVYNNLIVE